MALSAFCTVCQRTVYVEEGETPVCPVCSSPLLETVEGNGGNGVGTPEDEKL
jgi:Zn finger protein HypA/HybF involved in hydrogenase expression